MYVRMIIVVVMLFVAVCVIMSVSMCKTCIACVYVCWWSWHGGCGRLGCCDDVGGVCACLCLCMYVCR